MFLANTSDFFITLMAYNLDELFFLIKKVCWLLKLISSGLVLTHLHPKNTFPKAPLEIGLIILNSSMDGAREEVLEVTLQADVVLGLAKTRSDSS